MFWIKELPKDVVTKVDMVISDNLPGVLELRKDAILMGSFLWSELLMKRANLYPRILKFVEHEIGLLEKFKPAMICQKEMAMPLVKSLTNTNYTNWMVEGGLYFFQIIKKKKFNKF